MANLPPSASPTHPQRLAALDVGSNSFNLLIAEADAHGWQPLLRTGTKVQLAAGLRDGQLDDDAIARGLACLEGFGAQLKRFDVTSVRAVATEALRCARNAPAFLGPARAALGHPVELITGREEGRLVYRAVSKTLTGRNLVVDIGGASTELIIGTGAHIECMASVPIGCVNLLRHFPGGALSPANLGAAVAASRAALQAACRDWPLAQVPVVGCSGTVLAVAQVLLAHGWSTTGIRPAGLAALRDNLLSQHPTVASVRYEGLSESRRSVFVSGLAIVMGLVEALPADALQVSAQALREGVLEDLWQRHLRHPARLGAAS